MTGLALCGMMLTQRKTDSEGLVPMKRATTRKSLTLSRKTPMKTWDPATLWHRYRVHSMNLLSAESHLRQRHRIQLSHVVCDPSTSLSTFAVVLGTPKSLYLSRYLPLCCRPTTSTLGTIPTLGLFNLRMRTS